MQADLFVLTKDLDKAERAQSLIARHLDPGIQVVAHDLEAGLSSVRSSLAYRYIQLLRAAVPAERNLNFEVTTMDWSYAERRLYISIYWPVLVSGYWSEIDDASVYFESYYFNKKATAYPEKRGLDLFFPALAIYNRLFLVPMGHRKFLDQLGSPIFGQSHYDVIEVDFNDASALEQTIQRLGEELKRDISRDALAYTSRVGSDLSDVARLSEVLNVTPSLVERSLKEYVNDVAVRYRSLTCSLSTDTFTVGVSTRVDLLIQNDADRAWPDLVVTIESSQDGPLTILPRGRLDAQVDPRSTHPEPIAITVAGVGDFPIEVTLVSRKDLEVADRLPRHRIWIKSVAPAG